MTVVVDLIHGVTQHPTAVEMDTATSVWNATAQATNRTPVHWYVQQTACRQYVTFIIYTGIAGVFCLLGFAGNSVSFVVLAKDKGTPVASFLLQALAFTDNFFLCAWFLHFSLADAFVYFKLEHTFHITWLYVRVYTYPLTFIGQTGTIWLTVLIAATRYIAVCKPYHAAKYCSMPVVTKGVVAVAAFSVLYNVPRFFETKVVRSPLKNGASAIVHTLLGKSPLYQLVYFDILYCIFSFVLPLVLLIYLNTRLMLAYRIIQRRRRSLSSRSRQDGSDHNITLVMIIVILLFILCNAPARIVQLIWSYKAQRCPTLQHSLITISNVLEVFNSSANFLIYCVFRQKFRQILQHKICSNDDSTTVVTELDTTRPLNGSVHVVPSAVTTKTHLHETDL